MSCGQFEKYELGQLKEKEFYRHLKACASCQKQVQQNAYLMSLAKSLKKFVKAPHLWERIEKSLKEEQRTKISTQIYRFRPSPFLLIPAVAVFIMAVVMVLYFWFIPHTGKSNLLSQSALAKVEKKEKEYMKAIEELEQVVRPQMANLDLELMLLYRDRLETIDEQIDQCKEALLENPANAHIRRYMLAALQDKKQTLSEILSSHRQFQEQK